MNNGCNTGQDLKSLRGKMPGEPLVVEGLCLEIECGVILTCVTKTTTYSPLGKLSYTSETVYTDKDGNPIEGREVSCPTKVEIVEQPPVPITLEGQDCAGDAVEVTGLPGQLTHVVQAPGTVFDIRFCDDAASRDWELIKRCTPDTGAEILFQWDVKTNPPTLLSATNLQTGEPYTGDGTELVTCIGPQLESDPVDMCDNGVTFIRWVVKKDGVPTGVKYDTDLAGAVYAVTSEAGVVAGKCEASCAKAPLGVVASWAI